MKKIVQFITFTFICSILFSSYTYAEDKIKIGLIIPLSGDHREIGESIVNSVRLAVNKIDSDRTVSYTHLTLPTNREV